MLASYHLFPDKQNRLVTKVTNDLNHSPPKISLFFWITLLKTYKTCPAKPFTSYFATRQLLSPPGSAGLIVTSFSSTGAEPCRRSFKKLVFCLYGCQKPCKFKKKWPFWVFLCSCFVGFGVFGVKCFACSLLCSDLKTSLFFWPRSQWALKMDNSDSVWEESPSRWVGRFLPYQSSGKWLHSWQSQDRKSCKTDVVFEAIGSSSSSHLGFLEGFKYQKKMFLKRSQPGRCCFTAETALDPAWEILGQADLLQLSEVSEFQKSSLLHPPWHPNTSSFWGAPKPPKKQPEMTRAMSFLFHLHN